MNAFWVTGCFFSKFLKCWASLDRELTLASEVDSLFASVTSFKDGRWRHVAMIRTVFGSVSFPVFLSDATNNYLFFQSTPHFLPYQTTKVIFFSVSDWLQATISGPYFLLTHTENNLRFNFVFLFSPSYVDSLISNSGLDFVVGPRPMRNSPASL